MTVSSPIWKIHPNRYFLALSFRTKPATLGGTFVSGLMANCMFRWVRLAIFAMNLVLPKSAAFQQTAVTRRFMLKA